MADNITVLGICKAEFITNARKTFEAIGEGPGAFGNAHCAAEGAAWDSPITHYMMNYSGAGSARATAYHGLQNGALPPVALRSPTTGEPLTWGQEGVIGAADAVEACSPSNMQIVSMSGLMPDAEWLAKFREAYGIVPRPSQD